jgi:hypothetical protein
MNSLISHNAKKLELHYFFNDSSHSLDAIIRNKCEYELLAIIKEVTTILNVELDIESEALLEGGLKDVWKFLGKNSGQIAIIISIVAMILSRVPLENKELKKLQIENEKLEQIERQLNIEKLKQELDKSESSEEININIEEVVEIFDENIKIKKHKSNFYFSIKKSFKVTHISTTTYTENNEKINEYFIEKPQFDDFILESDNLPIRIDDNAVIEIISPVLKKGKYKWKGIYNKTFNTIDFSMKDKDFKQDVIESNVPFKNGTCIDCILEINQKIDESGEIMEYGYSVATVLRVHDEKVVVETLQGKKYRQQKDADKRQYKLYPDNDEKQ